MLCGMRTFLARQSLLCLTVKEKYPRLAQFFARGVNKYVHKKAAAV